MARSAAIHAERQTIVGAELYGAAVFALAGASVAHV
jgi:hypothetical protein